jgi:hypothetical protein
MTRDEVRLARRAELEEYVRLRPHPALLLDTCEPGSALDTTQRQRPEHVVAELELLWLCKKPGAGDFMAMITIGRDPTSDVVLSGAGVSKFHAFVLRGDGSAMMLVDAGSTYGTRVDGKALKPRDERHTLREGERISMGSVHATYHSPPSLHATLRRLFGP